MWIRTLKDLTRNPPAAVAAVFILLLVVVAVVGEHIVPLSPNSQDLRNALAGPSAEHWLGQDALGRDIFSRLVVATRVTMTALALGLGVAVLLGIPMGLLTGFLGGPLDALLSRFVDALMALPGLILALAIIGIAGSGLTNAMIAVGVVTAPEFYRVARGVAQNIKNSTFIEAAHAEGTTRRRIVFAHVLPVAFGPLLVQITFNSGQVILAEAALSFLGLGVQPPTASWGSMLQAASDSLFQAAFPLFPPALMIILTVLAFQVLGDGVRDALSGRTKR